MLIISGLVSSPFSFSFPHSHDNAIGQLYAYAETTPNLFSPCGVHEQLKHKVNSMCLVNDYINVVSDNCHELSTPFSEQRLTIIDQGYF